MSALKNNLLQAVELTLAGLHRAEANLTSSSTPETRAGLSSKSHGFDPAKAGKWNAAHELVQQYEDDATAAWIHAVLHKLEGDLANSRYWYRRADRMDRVAGEPHAELTAIQAELTTDGHGFSHSSPGKTQLLQADKCFTFRPDRFAMSDQDIQKLESQFPAISGSAFATARERVLKSGQSVLQSENGVVYEVFPDGRRVEVKKIEPPTQFKTGSIFTIK
jgi:hypothetical protein